jgi:hypothetical protein
MSNNNSWDFLDTLTMISFAMQIINFQENQQQSNNDDIMAELQAQDRKYLDKILENQNKILSILSEHETDMSVK